MIPIPITEAFLKVSTIGIRVSGTLLFAPFFGSVAIAPRIKAMLMLTLTAMFYSFLSLHVASITLSQWPMTAFSELMIGAATGIVSNMVFDGVQMAGQILSTQLGYSLVNILDPNTQVESTVMATLHQTVAMLIFLRAGVHLSVLGAIAHSFAYLPPAQGIVTGEFASGVLHVGASVFSVGVQIAAPVLSATLLCDIALALLGKAAPQLPLMLLGPALKNIPGLLILAAALRYWPNLFETLFLYSIRTTDRLLHLAS
jgi:flagellar biosynthetic protein FliR